MKVIVSLGGRGLKNTKWYIKIGGRGGGGVNKKVMKLSLTFNISSLIYNENFLIGIIVDKILLFNIKLRV